MAVPFWEPGKLYQPGDLVRPTSAGDIENPKLLNPSLEDGNEDWTLQGSGEIEIAEGTAFDGTWRIRGMDTGAGPFVEAINDAVIKVKAGQVVTATCMAMCLQHPGLTRAGITIRWFNASMQSLGKSTMTPDTTQVGGTDKVDSRGLAGWNANNFWTQLVVSGVAPANAAFFQVAAELHWLPDGEWLLDKFTLDYAGQAQANPFTFRAVQAEAGFTGSAEPEWPNALGETVVDNEVTWEAVASSNVVWEAHRILVSGSDEPAFPEGESAAVPDNTISWVMDPRRVTDSNAPRSKVALIAASKVFSGGEDIVPFSATVNPLDWTTEEDAGYLPSGLQAYGANPVAALGLYRGNVVVFNAQGFQMWQVDEDPANMALLDAGPIGCTHHRSGQGFANDWVFLTDVGFRNIGIAAASTNLQAGYFGKAVDELVVPKVKALGADDDCIGLYDPGRGQYWGIFGNEAFVLTANGEKNTMSWSTYTFPSAITDWTILNGELYLRSGDKIWKVDDDALLDDQQSVVATENYLGYSEAQAPASPWQLGDFEYVASSPGFLAVSSTPVIDGFNGKVFRSSGSAFATPFLVRRADGEPLNFTGLRIATDAAAVVTISGYLAADASIGDPADFTQQVNTGADTGSGKPMSEVAIAMPGIRALSFSTGLSAASEMYLVDFTYDGGVQGEEFEGELWWHYIDATGSLGADGSMEAFDLVIEGQCDVSFGYDQTNEALATPPYTVSGDTLPGTPIPMPLTAPSFQMRLTFAGNQKWKWLAAKLHM
jgi:hypothetical protein